MPIVVERAGLDDEALVATFASDMARIRHSLEAVAR
jgi:hypothetical protein